MGKYEPLATRLRDKPEEWWTATFDEIEEVLGFPLPPSARNYREWWSNQRGGGHSQSRGWQDAGWQVWKVDVAGERVTFHRRPDGKAGGGSSPTDSSDSALFEQASAYLGISDRQQVVREALKALCQREAGRRLARLGGTMPDLKIPPRRRPPY